MAITYDGLWRLLSYKNMSAAELRKYTGIAPNTMTKLRRNEDVALSILGRICKELDCDFGDIVSYIPEISEEYIYEYRTYRKGGDDLDGE